MQLRYFKLTALLFFVVFITSFLNAQELIRCSTNELEDNIILSDPSYLIRRDQIEINIQKFLQSQYFESYKNTQRSTNSAVIKIPVVIHLIGNNIISQVSIFKVQQQLQVLNNDFRKILGTNGDGNGVDTEIEFCLASLDPNGNATNGIVTVSGSYGSYGNNTTDNTNLKSLSHWPASSYLNVWICNVNVGLLAWGTFPSMYLNTLNEYQDGVVCGVNYFGITTHTKYGSGRTLSHEVGHWLDLRHTWGDKVDCSGSDGVYDTPFCNDKYFSTYSSGCQHPQQCTNENDADGLTDIRQIENYMDYSDDLCMSIFTSGQKDRMLATLYSPRSSLFYAEGGCKNDTEEASGTGFGSCDGSGAVNSIFNPNPECATVQFKINGKSTNDIINVCNKDITITPFRYNSSCSSNAKWLFRTNYTKKLCSNTLNMSQAGSKEYSGVFNNKCTCWWVQLFIGIQECDENKNLIGSESNQWFYIFDSDQSLLNEPTSFKSFNLNNYLPSGFQMQEGKYYKIKVASYDKGDVSQPWCEHNGYLRIYADDLLIQNKTITHDQFANNITIENSIVPALTHIKVVAKTKIEILPNTTLKSGRYYIANFDCNSLDQFKSMASNSNNSVNTQSLREHILNNSYFSPNGNYTANDSSNIVNDKKLENKSERITVYPNPATNEINIEFEIESNQFVTATLYDVNSYLVSRITSSKIFAKGLNRIKFNSSEIANGVYFIKLVIDDETITQKIVILHN